MSLLLLLLLDGTKREREGGLWTVVARSRFVYSTPGNRSSLENSRSGSRQMPPPSRPSLAGSLLRSAAIPSYYRNIRFNGERQGITMRDTTPKRAIFHPGIPFFLSFFLPSFLPPPRPSGVNSNPRYVSHPTMVFDVYGFRRA